MPLSLEEIITAHIFWIESMENNIEVFIVPNDFFDTLGKYPQIDFYFIKTWTVTNKWLVLCGIFVGISLNQSYEIISQSGQFKVGIPYIIPLLEKISTYLLANEEDVIM